MRMNVRRTICGIIICVFGMLASSYGVNYFKNPESVVFDSARNRYLVSNKGDGKIIQVDSAGMQSIWNTDQSSIRGLHIMGDTLCAACNAGLAVFNLNTGIKITTVSIQGRNFLNDVTSDSAGMIYITDSNNDCIYRVNSNDWSYTTYKTGLNINGIFYDCPNNRLIVCYWGANAPIKAVSLADQSVSTLANTSYSNFDGIARDTDGRFYVSSWGSNSIYRFEADFSGTPEKVSDGHNGPADICINLKDNILAVPNFNNNTVNFLPLTATDIQTQSRQMIDAFDLSPNFPNPFNPSTTVAYQLPKAGDIQIEVFDIQGRQIQTLISQYQDAGKYNVVWNGKNSTAQQVPSGSYIIRMRCGNFMQTRKVLLLK